MDEFEIKLSAQMSMKLAQLESRVEVANTIMKEVMDAYKRICVAEQERMDVMMLSICEMNGKTLPKNYEYSYDQNNMTVSFRSPIPQGMVPNFVNNGNNK